MIVRNKCIKCKHKWKAPPGPGTCPSCGSKYYKWSSYSFDKKKDKTEFCFGKY